MIKYLVAMFVITNPIAAVPIFISLTADREISEQKRTALRATFAIFCILIIVTWAGLPLLHFFGIDIGAFKVAGGIIILLMGLSMLHDQHSPIKHSKVEHEQALTKENVAIVPIALPLMAGPGAISTIITWANDHPGIYNHAVMSGMNVIITIILGFFLFYSGFIKKVLGASGVSITSKIMGMVLSAIAIDMIASGLYFLFPILKNIIGS